MQDGTEILHDTATELRQEWGLQASDIISEETILKLLAAKISEIISEGPGTFYQLMYKLDISEKKLNELHGSENAAEKIARLVYVRQLEKVKSRHATRQNPGDIDPELKW